MVDELSHSLRTTSFLLHPPLLDELGFVSAAKWFVEGFTKRSGINVHCDLQETLERLPAAVELTLFRVLQESLTNIHRHSGATAATVEFVPDMTVIKLEINDNGHGLSAEQLGEFRQSAAGAGVGIAGMRERVRDIGGDLEIQSEGAGTTITVTASNEQKARCKTTSAA